jgi:hypothetical protein
MKWFYSIVLRMISKNIIIGAKPKSFSVGKVFGDSPFSQPSAAGYPDHGGE